MQISIHTSAREVTKWWRGFHYGTGISIHTSAREVTRVLLIAPCKKGNFNPHFRKGSDRTKPRNRRYRYNFNPHFRKGSDSSSSLISLLIDISIHTSAREVTTLWQKLVLHLVISIHTSAREVTVYAIYNISFCKFQSTLPQGK